MKITFIRPNLSNIRSPDAWEPLVFAILAGLTPSNIELEFFDEHLEPLPRNHDTDLVALTVDTFTARRAYQIASEYRQRGIQVVVGGYHPSFLPDEALVYSDAVVIGDVEDVWLEVLRDAKQGKLQQIYQSKKLPSLAELNCDRSIFVGKRYNPISFIKFFPIQYSRGCRYACDFCSIHAFYGSRTRHRPVEEVVAEIENLDCKNLIFIDDNLFANEEEAEKLFRALIPLKVRWACLVSIDIAKNNKLLRLMAKSGCVAAAIGFESVNKSNLSQMKKGWYVKDNFHIDAIQKFHDLGIMIYATFVFGYDDDTVDSFDITVEFAIRSKFSLCNFIVLTPTPGSRLYNRLLQENKLIYNRWWLDPNYWFGDATFRPLQMKPNELHEGCRRARENFYKSKSIIQRSRGPVANSYDLSRLGLYFTANMVVKRNALSNIGRRLGTDKPLVPHLENVPLQHTINT